MGMQPRFLIEEKSRWMIIVTNYIYLYQVGHTKPAPEIFDYMVNDCNIIPSETLFVDDGASNIQIGKELGFETFQPKNGADWREEMTAILEKW